MVAEVGGFSAPVRSAAGIAPGALEIDVPHP